MSFDYSTLITDRTRSDSDTLKTLLSKPMAEWTAEERTAFNGAVMRGSYDYTDLNRVDACLEDLVARLGRVGCNVPGYERLKIERAVTPSSRLPEGYTEVQFIRSDGGQHIDSLIKPTQNMRVNIRFSTSETGSHTVFGSDIGWTENGFSLGVGFAHYGKANRTISGLSDGNPHDVDFKKNVVTVDGVTVSTMETATFSLPYNLALFANNRSGSIQEKTSMTLYNCIIYENEIAVRDFIPCKNPSGNIGLYDVISGEFYGNAGSGSFTAGPPRATLPEGYTQLEYIQSTGIQYINTEFNPSSETRVDMTCEPTTTGTWKGIFGARKSASVDEFGVDIPSTTAIRSIYGTESQNLTVSTVLQKFSIVKNKNVCTVNGTAITHTKQNFTTSFPIRLFDKNSGGSAWGQISMKLYSCQIYDNGTPVRNFIPCKNPSGVVGLYDLVDGKFYTNAVAGNFTAGETVTWPEEPVTPNEPTETLDPYTWYESDVPVPSLLARYRANVAAVRAALRLPEGTPETPETMRRLTVTEANSIEAILLALNFILNNIPTAVRHCGVTVCGSKGVRA